MRQIILFESFKHKHKALVLLAQPVTPLYLCYLQKKYKIQSLTLEHKTFVLFVQPATQLLFFYLQNKSQNANSETKTKHLGCLHSFCTSVFGMRITKHKIDLFK
jgi:hypothetical protein